MSKHTPEPWILGRACTVVSDTPVPGMGGSDAVEYYGGHLIGESIVDANARRIVACVNACAGLPTEQLESSPPGGIINGVAGLIAQRNELLAALEIIAASEEFHGDSFVCDFGTLQGVARAAIAKAKGGAA